MNPQIYSRFRRLGNFSNKSVVGCKNMDQVLYSAMVPKVEIIRCDSYPSVLIQEPWCVGLYCQIACQHSWWRLADEESVLGWEYLWTTCPSGPITRVDHPGFESEAIKEDFVYCSKVVRWHRHKPPPSPPQTLWVNFSCWFLHNLSSHVSNLVQRLKQYNGFILWGVCVLEIKTLKRWKQQIVNQNSGVEDVKQVEQRL